MFNWQQVGNKQPIEAEGGKVNHSVKDCVGKKCK